MGDIRTPPRPPSKGAGHCTMCGTYPLPARRRSWCSDDCVEIWTLATIPRHAFWQLLELLGHRCWRCGDSVQPGVLSRYDRLGYVSGPAAGQGWSVTGADRSATWCNRPEYGPPAPRAVTLELEHIRPLWSLNEAERLELRWWLPYNLQLLCVPCHRAKTRTEAAQRATYRRTGVIPPLVDQPALL